MGGHINLNTSGTQCIGAYLARTEGKAKGGIVVVQEIFGVNSHIQQTTDGFAADGYLAMNATYSKTMTQFLNDTSDGLKVTWTTNSPTRIEGRITAAKPLKTMDGETYTVDLRFGVDVPKPPAGDALPAGGGEPGKAFAAFVAAAQKKNWATIKAGASPEALKMFDKSYNTPAENAAPDRYMAEKPISSITPSSM
jgi:hypothetical protein